jgi:Ca-activated chloride channel homolog
MGRHAVLDEQDTPVGTYRLSNLGRLGVVAAAVVTLIGIGVLLGAPDRLPAGLPWAAGAKCAPRTVDLVVSPELVSVVTTILKPLNGRDIGGNRCLETQVRGQEPQETVLSSEVLPIDRVPQIWIPDTAVWGQKAQLWQLSSAGTLATSPVVLATSAKAVTALGWAKRSPTWQQALQGTRPVAVPDYEAQSESLDALIALWQSLGKKSKADQAVVATVFAADRGELPSLPAAIADARSGSANAPLFPASEQLVAYLNATSTVPGLQAVYPREGSPMLTYPIFQVAGTARDDAEQAAGQTVVNRLISNEGQDLVRQAGFRDSTGSHPVGTGIRRGNVQVLNPPGRAEVDGMIRRIEALAKPTRILAVMDVSLSMQARLADGLTRIDLVGAAARLGVNLLPDSGAVGAWVFASRMDGTKDYREIAPVKRLGGREPSGETHRSYLMRQVGNVKQYLHGGGTSLYDVTIAATKKMHKNFDPRANNSVILMSDGANQDPSGATLAQVLSQIRTLNRGKQKVAIYTAGLGPDADYSALRQIADASGGWSYRIDTAQEGQVALLDGLRRSRHLGS